MKELIHKIMLVVAAFTTASALTITGMATEIYTGNYYFTTPSVEQMVRSLYENEPDPIIRSMAIDSALILTGNKEPETYYTNGAILVGRYQAASVEPSVQCTISLLGEHSMRLGENGRSTAVSTSPGELLTDAAKAQNIQDLSTIYNMVNAVKIATAGMNDIQKLQYIETYVIALAPTYAAGTDSVMAKTVNTGICDCEGYASLTYLFGINCGLNIKCVMGIANGGNHTWNEITIGEVTYWHDTTWDKTTGTDKYFLTAPDSYDPSEQYVIHDITQINPISVTYQEVR